MWVWVTEKYTMLVITEEYQTPDTFLLEIKPWYYVLETVQIGSTCQPFVQLMKIEKRP